MNVFRRKSSKFLVPVHPDNARKTDWIILLEANTIVGEPREKLRVAHTTRERKLVKRYGFSLKAKHYLVVEDYDPRIHALYFCPQLFRYEDTKLVPLEGAEIGQLIARALENGASERRPWYEPLQQLPDQPVINAPMQAEYDSVVVELPAERSSA